MKFDLDKFKNEIFVVHCDTVEKAKKFMIYLHNKGFGWVDGEPLIN